MRYLKETLQYYLLGAAPRAWPPGEDRLAHQSTVLYPWQAQLTALLPNHGGFHRRAKLQFGRAPLCAFDHFDDPVHHGRRPIVSGDDGA